MSNTTLSDELSMLVQDINQLTLEDIEMLKKLTSGRYRLVPIEDLAKPINEIEKNFSHYISIVIDMAIKTLFNHIIQTKEASLSKREKETPQDEGSKFIREWVAKKKGMPLEKVTSEFMKQMVRDEITAIRSDAEINNLELVTSEELRIRATPIEPLKLSKS
jgi:hypothetical protein